MNVIVSMAAVGGQIVYHKPNCMYAKRIKLQNRMRISETQIARGHYRTCKYCQGLRGEVRTNEEVTSWEKKYGISIDYVEKSDTLYIRTEIGCWKIFCKEEEGKYFLYHRNTYDKKISFGQAINGEYHRQKDVKPTSSIHKLIHYIAAHDKAKQVIQDDYRKLPQSTKKQKKYYRQVKKKVQRNTLKHTRLRMDALFKSIESQDPSLYRLSLC